MKKLILKISLMICSLYLLSCRASEDLSIENTLPLNAETSQGELKKAHTMNLSTNTISADINNTKKDPPIKDKQDWKIDPKIHKND
ncbi:hypothetical protein [Elizabethkingia anophelis]|uniref:hypothetical protein n=1 Tax=Elizabethkingia anophelis TaxID=1117645 RepID=UPI003F1C1454